METKTLAYLLCFPMNSFDHPQLIRQTSYRAASILLGVSQLDEADQVTDPTQPICGLKPLIFRLCHSHHGVFFSLAVWLAKISVPPQVFPCFRPRTLLSSIPLYCTTVPFTPSWQQKKAG